MEIRYQRNLNHNYLIIEKDALIENDYQLQMITQNEIKGLLSCTIHRIDNQIQLYYEISSKYPLKQIYERKKMSYKELEEVLVNVLAVIRILEEYLLDGNHLLLSPEFIYINPGHNGIEFCFFPGYSKEIGKNFHETIEYILNCVDYKDEKAVALAYELYKYTAEDNCSIQDLLDSIISNHTGEEIQGEILTEETENKGFDDNSEDTILKDTDIQKKQKGFEMTYTLKMKIRMFKSIIDTLSSYIIKKKDKDSYSSDETMSNSDNTIYEELIRENQADKNIELEDYGDTLYILPEETAGRLTAENKSQFSDIELQWFPFIIGKLKDAVDGIIEDDSVSRIHAKIEKEDHKYYAKDLNSTNGTYVNHVKLIPEEPLQLNTGDEVRFGKVVYYFQ